MAKFLNTSKTISALEDLINNAEKELILISPYLKLTDKLRDLLADKNRLKVDMRIVYGKTELAPEEMNWLKTQSYIRVSFYKELHAKCYLNEKHCIITSLNLLEYSINNNYEMGILIENRDKDDEESNLYKEAYEEAKRIIRNSKDVNNASPEIASAKPEQKSKTDNNYEKLTTYNLAKKLGLKDNRLVSTKTYYIDIIDYPKIIV
jgi:phosphatidylserine/phosphatidylglycerophosphate/cardiolipin synthase-like enzyme